MTTPQEEATRPLLGGPRENLTVREDTVFAVDDDSDDGETLLTPTPTVRFEEHVQVIGPPLRSTIQSRETG
jgi:sodium-coupled neutral amino acid transporter 11